MEIFADLHLHTKYSRGTSKNMDLENMSKAARKKGIHLLACGDFTHPLWVQILKSSLEPKGKGVYFYQGIYFILSGEVCNIFYRNGEAKKIHNIIFVPDFTSVEKINLALSQYGELHSDGRPILNLEAKNLVKIVLNINPDCLIIPAHVWTPHFSLFGSNSGFDSVEECFEEETKNIFALETGLSSDPAMNWRLSGLDRYALVSNSDAHSPQRLGRELNVFEITDYKDLYRQITQIIKTKDKKKFLYTIEFFPEEGKYHFDGHRNCKVRLNPKDAIAKNNQCPVCKRTVTIGVMHRVEELADRADKYIPESAIPFKNLIPLEEIIASVLNVGRESQIVNNEYEKLVNYFGNEFAVLLNAKIEDLEKVILPQIAQGIIKVRKGEVEVTPGYDGVYGEIKIFTGEKSEPKSEQLSLF